MRVFFWGCVYVCVWLYLCLCVCVCLHYFHVHCRDSDREVCSFQRHHEDMPDPGLVPGRDRLHQDVSWLTFLLPCPTAVSPTSILPSHILVSLSQRTDEGGGEFHHLYQEQHTFPTVWLHQVGPFPTYVPTSITHQHTHTSSCFILGCVCVCVCVCVFVCVFVCVCVGVCV